MAAHHIIIAKASFAAALLRPDVDKVSRDDIPKFHSALEAALVRCSRQNIQTCKEWLLQNVLVSAARISAFGKYLTTVSRHIGLPPDETVRTSLARQRLHILYLVNDLLHHSKHHTSEATFLTRVTSSLQPFLLDLFQLASAERKKKVARRLAELLELWEHEQYFGAEIFAQLRDAVAGVQRQTAPVAQEQDRADGKAKEPPYVLPATHGDPSLRFYDLPAGNLVPHIIPNSSQSIRPEDVHALRLPSGPADETLVNALKDFLNDVQGIDNTISKLEKEGTSLEFDEMGQISYRDEADDLVGDTYYGWSRSFCEKMKRRGRSDTGDSSRQTGSNSASRSRSRSRGRNPYKRRRYSASTDERSRSSRSYSRSTSRRRYGGSREERSVSRHHSQSQSRSPPGGRHLKGTGSEHPSTFIPPAAFSNAIPVPPTMPARMGLPFPPPPPPLQPGSLPLFPPRPDHWAGPWPPPPPPPPPPPYPPGNAAFHSIQFPPPPPNLPPPPHSPAGWPPAPPGEAYRGSNGYAGRR